MEMDSISDDESPEQPHNEEMPSPSFFEGAIEESPIFPSLGLVPASPSAQEPEELQELVEEIGIDAAIDAIADPGASDSSDDDALQPFVFLPPRNNDLESRRFQYSRLSTLLIQLHSTNERREQGDTIRMRSGAYRTGVSADEDVELNRHNLLTAEEILSNDEVRFDTNLPAEHSYFGTNASRVPGVSYLEVGSKRRMLIFLHQNLLLPGELLPFMINRHILLDCLEHDEGEGALFGIVFPFVDGFIEKNMYGVTCQIYERGSLREQLFFKSRALQRFVVEPDDILGTPQYISRSPTQRCYGIVKILPECYLAEPLKSLDMGSMKRLRDLKYASNTYKRFQTITSSIPPFVYNLYNIENVVKRAKAQLERHKIDTMPTCIVQLSFWLMRNLHLSEQLVISLFVTNSVNERIKLIGDSLNADSMFYCRNCHRVIAFCSQLFAMSKHGVQTQYCNSGGYIHETNTVYRVIKNSIRYSGTASTEFSWFPGYQWRIIICRICHQHIGWEFTALEPDLAPKTFYGLSGSMVSIGPSIISREADIE